MRIGCVLSAEKIKSYLRFKKDEKHAKRGNECKSVFLEQIIHFDDQISVFKIQKMDREVSVFP